MVCFHFYHVSRDSVHHSHEIVEKGEMLRRKTHNFVIRRTGVVSPSGLLHDPARHSLEVVKVVALRQERLLLLALLARNLIRVIPLALTLDSRHVDGPEVLVLGEVLVKGIWGVNRLIFFCGVLALRGKVKSASLLEMAKAEDDYETVYVLRTSE